MQTDYFYPDSYSSEIGVFSSDDGITGWAYHGIVVPRGPFPGWDGGGVASPGAAAAPNGDVVVGFVGEKDKSGGYPVPSSLLPRMNPAPNSIGGNNRGIGLATAPHPLGPFTKQKGYIASPEACHG